MKHRRKLAKTRSGGVAVIYKETLENQIKIADANTQDCLWFTINMSNKKILLCGNLYIPPKGSRFYKNVVFEKIEADLIDIKVNTEHDEILIAGDFNARTTEKIDYITLNEFIAHENGMGDDIIEEFDIENKLKLLNIPLKRMSRDKAPLNQNGKGLLNLCKDHGLLIANGRVGQG